MTANRPPQGRPPAIRPPRLVKLDRDDKTAAKVRAVNPATHRPRPKPAGPHK